MGGRVERQAPAKVNLLLRVLARRPDGYHDIETLFQSIDLADDVVVEVGGSGVRLEVEGPDLGPPAQNLAVRAAAAYRRATGMEPGVRIALRKRIPAGAGLGGGSSDAAAVLASLAAFQDDHDDERLRALAATIGSDVAFFLCGSALAHGRGRGEEVTPLRPLPAADLVVVVPPVHVSTAEAYRSLAARRGDAPLRPRPAPTAPGSWADVRDWAVNEFEPLVAELHPEVSTSLAALRAAGAGFALLSGSGSASFGYFDDREHAERAAYELGREPGWTAFATRTLTAVPRARVERPGP